MLEASQSYFLPYRHVIGAMQRLGEQPLVHARPGELVAAEPALHAGDLPRTSLPFVEYLANARPGEVGPPVYLSRPGAAEYDMSCIYSGIERLTGRRTFNIMREWPRQLQRGPNETKDDGRGTMDHHQREALQHILTKRLAVLQGPPGTGKVSQH